MGFFDLFRKKSSPDVAKQPANEVEDEAKRKALAFLDQEIERVNKNNERLRQEQKALQDGIDEANAGARLAGEAAEAMGAITKDWDNLIARMDKCIEEKRSLKSDHPQYQKELALILANEEVLKREYLQLKSKKDAVQEKYRSMFKS